MKTAAVLLGVASLAAAYPSMTDTGSEADIEKRLLGGLLGGDKDEGLLPAVDGLLDSVEGLVGSVAAAVDLDNKRPEPGFTFKAPGKGDSRGPCPALNLLANYG